MASALRPRRPTDASQSWNRLLRFPDIPAIYPQWRKLVVAHSVLGVRVHDARIVAAMKVHGVKDIVTFNVDDYVRYPSIRVLHPTDLVPKPEDS